MLTEVDKQLMKIAFDEGRSLDLTLVAVLLGRFLPAVEGSFPAVTTNGSAGRSDCAWRDGCVAQGWAAKNLS